MLVQKSRGIDMKLSLSRKILIVALTVSVVTVISSYITYQYINRVNQNSLRVLNVELPLEESFLEMEIGISETTRAVLDYIQDYQKKHINVLTDSEAEFEAHANKFILLCETPEEKILGSQVALLYSQYSALGHEIIGFQDLQNEALLELRDKVNSVMYTCEEFAQFYSKESQPRQDDKKNMLAIFEYVKLVAELHTELEGVLAKHNPSYELDLGIYSTKLQNAQLSYTGTIDSSTERAYLSQIYDEIEELFIMSEELISIADKLNNNLEMFENNREQIEIRLEDQIKTLVNEKKETIAHEAIYSSRLTLNTSLFDSFFGFALISGLLFGINQWIITPVIQLSTGFQSFAAGTLSQKIMVKSDDEIGQLASAFNEMTTQIEEKIDTITKNENTLAELNIDLKNEIQVRKEYEKEMLRVASDAEVDRMRSQFLSTITHELRTPLTSIKGYIEILRSGWVGEVPPEMDELLSIVIRNTNRLSTLTSDLLDVQRITSGRLEVNLTDFDLNEIIDNSVHEIRPLLLEKSQTLEVDTPGHPLIVLGDKERLSQVVMNILTNASKFSNEQDTIKLKVEENIAEINVSISDNGIGIKKEDLERIFKPLAMIDKPIYVKGTGLGLSVSKGIIDLHNGKIWAVSSGEWKGSTFYFTLPKMEEK